MQFLTPLGLLLAALAVPIILLYMLKLRRKPVQVSSTLLWERLLRDRQANAPWQKLKRNLLLFLQLLILAALVLAFARPALLMPVVASGSVVVLLDASASMNAADVEPSRFESARQVVGTLIDGLPGGSRMTLILVNATPNAIASAETDRAALKQALAGAQPTLGSADWESAFALAAGASRGSPDTTLIVSDGGLPKGLPALPGQVRYVPVGMSSGNLAVTAMALRPTAQNPQLFAEVTNYSADSRTALLSVYLGEQLIDARQFNLGPGENQSLTLDNLSTTPGIYRARISSPADAVLDAFPLDDTAFAVYQASAARRVLLVSKGNLFLEQLLAALPGIQPFRALPDANGALQIPNEPFDLTILDGIAPAELPAGNLLFVNPPLGGNDLFQVGAPFKEMENVQVHDHPLTRSVDWTNVHVLQAKNVPLPAWAEALVSVDAGPLVFAGAAGNRRVAALTFDLRESDLPLQVTFPILFSNLINDLVPPGAFDAMRPLRPGETLAIALQPGIERATVVSPSQQGFEISPGPNGYTFAETGELGYYAVNFIAGGEVKKVEYFAVNLFDPSESDIRVRETVQVGRAAIQPAAAEQAGQLELWPWLAALALLVLLIEWQAYHRRRIPLPPNPNSGFRGRGIRQGRPGGGPP